MNVGIRVGCYFVEENCSVVINSNIWPLDWHELCTKHLLILISTVPRNTTTFATRWYVYCKGKLALIACITQGVLLGSWKRKFASILKKWTRISKPFADLLIEPVPFHLLSSIDALKQTRWALSRDIQSGMHDIDYSFSTVFCKKSRDLWTRRSQTFMQEFVLQRR